MKKFTYLASAAVISLAIAGNANAESTGCGLGTMLFDGNKGVAPNVLAVTTNNVTSGNQTFGISSGTLGCNRDDVIDSRGGKLFSFANDNLSELAADTSKGEGEYLNIVAAIIGIKKEDKEHFFITMQENFSTIFPNENIKTANVVLSVKEVMQKDQILKSYKI